MQAKSLINKLLFCFVIILCLNGCSLEPVEKEEIDSYDSEILFDYNPMSLKRLSKVTNYLNKRSGKDKFLTEETAKNLNGVIFETDNII